MRFVVIAIGSDAAAGAEARAHPDALDAALEASLRAAGATVIELAPRGATRVALVEDGGAAGGGEPSPRLRARELRRAVSEHLRGAGLAVDVAAQPAAGRMAPRLLVMDVDSTLIQIEVIDELARRHGVGAAVAEVTERAMRGELDFEASLRARVSKLAGLRAEALTELAAELPLSPGAERLVSELLARGAEVAIASGGFTFATEVLRRRLGLTAAFANELEVQGGVVTGRVVGPVVTAERKAEIVGELARRRGLAAAETVAIGDGANDRAMLAAAGFGIAFRGKPALVAVADAAIDHGGLDRALEFLPSP
ncbi:MAG: phosphoserine phosphatase SerB [Kofleriaceae bacterium]